MVHKIHDFQKNAKIELFENLELYGIAFIIKGGLVIG